MEISFKLYNALQYTLLEKTHLTLVEYEVLPRFYMRGNKVRHITSRLEFH